MGEIVTVLATLTTLLCGVLLLRQWLASGARLLLWSGLCFAWLTVSNVLLYVDLYVPSISGLYLERLTTGAIGMLLLLYGLIWESDR